MREYNALHRHMSIYSQTFLCLHLSPYSPRLVSPQFLRQMVPLVISPRHDPSRNSRPLNFTTIVNNFFLIRVKKNLLDKTPIWGAMAKDVQQKDKLVDAARRFILTHKS